LKRVDCCIKNCKPDIPTDWVVNMTNIPIPENILKVLALGPKFSIPKYSNDCKFHDIAVFDNFVNNSEKDDLDKISIKNKFVDILKNNSNKKFNNIIFDRDINGTKKFLNNNKDIIITKADKGKYEGKHYYISLIAS